MFITVGEVLSLSSMKNAVLLAGKSGTSKMITSVNIMEVPGTSGFVKPLELVLTTLYPIRDSENLQVNLIPSLVEKGVSALAIVPLDHNKDIPSSMINIAEENDFPLIQLPMNTSFNEIINPILEQILERKYIETEYRFKSKIIGDLISGKIATRSQLNSLVKFYDWNLTRAFLPVIIKLDMSKENQFQFQLHKISKISKNFGKEDTIVANFDFGILLLFPSLDLKRQCDLVKSILNKYSEVYPTANIGIGRAISDILELPKGLREASLAADISEKIPTLGRIVDFEHLGIYKVLTLGNDDDIENKQDFAQENLSKLIEYDKSNKTDLISTLQIFFVEGNNMRKAADKLFIHYNTMSNRLKLIESITGKDLSNPEVRLEVYVALKLASIL